MKSEGITNSPCQNCGKTIRNSYKIGRFDICMDCADYFGISEPFEKDKDYRKNVAICLKALKKKVRK